MACESCGEKPENTAKDFTKAVVEINNPEKLVLFRKVLVPASMGDEESVPPAVGKYYNVLLVYEVNEHAYLYSSDGIPTRLTASEAQDIESRLEALETGLSQEELQRSLADQSLSGRITTLDNSLASVAKSGSYNDLTNKPTIGDGTLTIQKNGTSVGTFKANATSNTSVNITVPETDQSLNTASNNPVANSAVSTAINETVMTDISLNANASTTTVQLDGAKKNLYSGATSTKNIALPVASTTQAGVMNSATYDAITANSNNINAILNGAVAITGLSASPSQSDLTTAWQTETGLTTLINRASVYDVTNNKVWTYYTNDTTWHAASNASQVTVSTFTNNSEGVIKGSTNVGQVFAENDGTGSVNGWDTLSNAVATNTSDIATLQGSIPTVNNATLTIQNNGTNVATFTANSATNTTANIVPPVQIASTTSAGVAQLTDSTASNIYPVAGSAIADSIKTTMLQDGAVTEAKFADKAVSQAILTANNLVPAKDTPAAWITLLGGTSGKGYFITYINVANSFTNQPNQYGWLETIFKGNGIYQRWTTHTGGPVYYRAGNQTGWSPTSGAFKQIFDTVHNNITMQTTDPGEGATLAAGHFIAVYSA